MTDNHLNISCCGSFKLWLLPIALTMPVAHAELWFPPELITNGKHIADLSRFSQGYQLPGQYVVDIYLNERFVDNRKVYFVAGKAEPDGATSDSTGLVPLLTRDELIAAGVKREAFTSEAHCSVNSADRVWPGCIIHKAYTVFNFPKMRLDIYVPQWQVQRRPRNWTPPELWDEGITAGLLSWSFSGNNSFGNARGSSRYLKLSSGLNYGPWRVRDEMSISEYDDTRVWDHASLWAERGVTAWRSRIKIGDMVAGGRVFDSVRLRGASMMTDDDMYPDSEQGYAPLIRGTALSNARVSIRQRGRVIYEINVPPGEFIIDDVDPVYSGGDLEVSVREANGGIRRFFVPYATVPGLLRQGQIKYEFNVGYLQSSNYINDAKPLVIQGALMRGTAHEATIYGGLQLTAGYHSAAIGAGFNLGHLGAFSADITHAESAPSGAKRSNGQSVRFLYSRNVELTGTTFQLAGYRYSTGGYYTLEESRGRSLRAGDYYRQKYGKDRAVWKQRTDYFELGNHRRERMEVTINQRIMDRSSLYITGSRQTYWQRDGATTSFQAGISTTFKKVGLSLNYTENRMPSRSGIDRGIYASLTVPLAELVKGYQRPLSASLTYGSSAGGEVTTQTVLNGSALNHDALNWSVGQVHSRRNGDSSNFRLGYRGNKVHASAGLSQGRNYQQVSYDASGGLIVHKGGVTTAPYLGQTTVLIETPGVAGIPIAGGAGTVTDTRGYAVQPWAAEFRENRIAIDIRNLGPDTDIKDPVAHVVPTRGAVVKAQFKARTGFRMLLTLHKNGRPLPLGATVSHGDSSSIVGDNGQVYMSGVADRGSLVAKWGNAPDQVCRAKWNLSNVNSSSTSILKMSSECS